MTLLVGRSFADEHDFRSPAILADGSVKDEFVLSEHIAGKNALVFFYTMDFSFVCPTELVALANRAKAFAERNTEIIVISGDSHLAHRKWRETSPRDGGVGPLPFTMVSDISRRVARGYGVLVNDSISLRASFLIDRDGYFRHQSVYDLPIGRNVDELLRVIDGLRNYQRTGTLCPAGWQQGDEAIEPRPEALIDYMSRNAGKL